MLTKLGDRERSRYLYLRERESKRGDRKELICGVCAESVSRCRIYLLVRVFLIEVF